MTTIANQSRDVKRVAILTPIPEALTTSAAMGRVMLTTSAHGIVHERIGAAASAEQDGAHVHLAGPGHDAVIDLSAIGSLVVDRTARMGDRALPKLQALGHDGAVLFGLLALDGLEPFDAAIAGLALGDEIAPPAAPAAEPEAVLAEDDPVEGLLARLTASGEDVTLTFTRPGLVQTWTGKVSASRPMQGYSNVIQSDFHLHVRGGAIAGWRRVEGRDGPALQALTGTGEPTGLVLTNSAEVQAHV